MTVDDLIKLGKQQVRGNKDLLQTYIQLFKEKFGRTPDCAGCTFDHDWVKLTQQPTKKEVMSNTKKTFDVIKTGDIFSYDYLDEKTNRTLRKRSYGNTMTDDFAIAYLTNGTDEEIAKRKKQFRTLPEGLEATKAPDLTKLTVPELKEMVADFPKEEWEDLKKADLIAYIEAKELEAGE